MKTFTSLLSLLLAASSALAMPHHQLAKKRGIFDLTRNDLKDGKCADIVLIWARGTFELGNMGEVCGPELVDALALNSGTRNRFIAQGVDYPASVLGYFAGGNDEDATTMANLVALGVKQCPHSKIVIGGYSQGAQLVHKSIAKLTYAQAARVSAVVMFGDPDKGDTLANNLSGKSKTICNVLDFICDKLPLPWIPHLTYALEAGQMASFIAGQCA